VCVCVCVCAWPYFSVAHTCEALSSLGLLNKHITSPPPPTHPHSRIHRIASQLACSHSRAKSGARKQAAKNAQTAHANAHTHTYTWARHMHICSGKRLNVRLCECARVSADFSAFLYNFHFVASCAHLFILVVLSSFFAFFLSIFFLLIFSAPPPQPTAQPPTGQRQRQRRRLRTWRQ